MTTAVKILLALAGLLLVLFGVLVLAVTLIIDPDDYRPYLVSAVQKATGRHFQLDGELGLGLLPCCSISVGAARLDNPADFPQTGFVSFEHASAGLRLWPLLAHRRLEIGSVTLDGADVTLTRLPDGRDNWTLTGATEPSGSGADQPAALDGLRLESVVLRDARVRYQDLQSGLDITASGLGVETGSIDYGASGVASFPLEGSVTLRRDGTNATARLALETRLAASDQRLSLESPVLMVVAEGAAIPGGEATVRLGAQTLSASTAARGSITVTGLTVDVSALDSVLAVTGGGSGELTGDFTLQETSPRRWLEALSGHEYHAADDLALTRLAASGHWSLTPASLFLRELEVRLDASELTGSVEVEDLATGAANFDLDLDDVDLDRYGSRETPTPARASTPAGPFVVPLDALAGLDLEGTLRIGSLGAAGVAFDEVEAHLDCDDGKVAADVAARIAGGNLALAGRGTVSGSKPALTGHLEVTGISPRALLTALGSPPRTADPAALTSLSGSARWTLTPRSAALEDMRWHLDDTHATGSLRVDDLNAAAGRFDLSLDQLDLDAYLAPDEAQDAASKSPDAAIPVDAIRALNLSGRLQADALTLHRMPLHHALAELTAADGVLRVDPISAGLYGGTYRGSLTVDATADRAKIGLQQELRGVQVSDLLENLFGTGLLAGSLSLRLSGGGDGNTFPDLLRGLAADVSFDLSDGAYRGADVLYELERARARLHNETPPAAPATRETRLRALKAEGRVADGVFQTSQLTASTPALRLLGHGGINLLELSLDYQIDAEILAAGAAAAGLSDLANATVPLTLRGPLTSPRVGVDLEGLVTSRLRNAVEQKARNALQRLGDSPADAARAGAKSADTAPVAAAAESTQTPTAQPAAKPAAEDRDDHPSTRKLLKRGLRDLLTAPDPHEPASPDTERR